MTMEFELNLTNASNAKNVLKDSGAKDQREKLWMVPFEKLVILPDFNVREHDARREERIERFAQDMETNGYLMSKPMEVFVDGEGRIIVTDGHTRHEAIARARSRKEGILENIPCVPAPPNTTMKDLTVNLHKSNDSEKLSPLGLSILVERLVKQFGSTTAEAAKELGISPKYSKQLLLLAEAPARIRELIMSGQVSATFAIQMLEEHGENALEVLEQSLAGAKAKGKKRATKKNSRTPEDIKILEIQKHAITMYQLVETMFEIEDLDEKLPKDLHDAMENILAAVEAAEQAGDQE
jgi:ParB-like chromosome segregation protein Spo0J